MGKARSGGPSGPDDQGVSMMVKKRKEMRGIHLNPKTGHVYLNRSYKKFLRTMYGRKFPKQFVAMVNDLLDSALLETLDDMKKVIRYYEWKISNKDRRIEWLTERVDSLEDVLGKVRNYTEDLERMYSETREGVGETDLAMADSSTGAELTPAGQETEIGAGRETGRRLRRPAELSVDDRGGREVEASLGLGARLGEAEIGAGDLETSPQIAEIENKIERVKGMKALHSDEEIERIFGSSDDG